MAFYEGLVIYDPKTMGPYPGIAEKWDINDNFTEFTFHLRNNVRFSNGDPITAEDFVWSLRRGLDPKFAAEYAYIAYPILNAEGYNSGGSFVRNKATGAFDLDPATHTRRFVRRREARTRQGICSDPGRRRWRRSDGSSHRTLHADAALTLFSRHDGTSVLYGGSSQDHREVWRLELGSATEYRHQWTVSFDGMGTLRPHCRSKDPMYWDAANVRLDEIRFYPAEDTTTMMNLYKAGAVDGLDNHSVPLPWLDVMQPLKDYMDAPEKGNEYYQINTSSPPMNDLRVRKAFSLSIDRHALAKIPTVAKPLSVVCSRRRFPGYPAVGWLVRCEKAKQLLAEAGYRMLRESTILRSSRSITSN